MKKIIFVDTNALFIPIQFKIDLKEAIFEIIDEPFEIYVPDICIQELKYKLERTNSVKEKRDINFALNYSKQFKQYKTAEYPKGTDTDTILLNESIKKSAIVITNDKKLRLRLIKNNIPVISIRGNKRLEFANPKK